MTCDCNEPEPSDEGWWCENCGHHMSNHILGECDHDPEDLL